MNNISSFKFWCQKVLPTAYDDSLSYYELLCRVVTKLNETIDATNNAGNAVMQLQRYVDNYFSSLDVQDEVNKKLDSMADSGELDDLISRLADVSFSVVGGTTNYYVDGANGSDENDGLTRNTAFLTLNKALRQMNKGVDAQVTINLVGNRVYEIDPSIYVIWQGTPHFRSVGGSPTIKFLYASGTGPRFYSCHVNITGDAVNRIKVDSADGGVYFEGCSLALSYVDFLVPVRFLGGSAICSECSFTTKAGNSPAWAFTYRPCVEASGCAVRFSNITFNCTDGLSTGLFLCNGATGNITGNIYTVEQAQTGDSNSVIFADSSFVKVTPTFVRSDNNHPFKYLIRTNAAIIVCTSQDQYDSWARGGLLIQNATILIDNNVIKNAHFVTGKRLNLGFVCINGYVSATGKSVVGVITLPEKPIGVSGLNVSCSDVTIRAASTNTGGKTGKTVVNAVAPQNLGTFTVTAYSDYNAVFQIVFNDESLFANYPNCPVNILLKNAVVSAT